MCILPELDLILGALPWGPMLDLHFPFPLPAPARSPLQLLAFPSLFSVEQTETELPLLEQLLPACMLHCGEIMCRSVSLSDCALLVSFQGCRGEGDKKKRAGVTGKACFDACVFVLHMYFMYRCVLWHMRLSCPCLRACLCLRIR